MGENLKLPLIDLSSSDRISTSKLIRQACVESGFFYLINHGVEDELIKRVFDESKKFFSLPVEEKMKLERKGLTGYTPIYAETLDPTLKTGDLKESIYIGPLNGVDHVQNRWPSEGEQIASNKEMYGASAHSDYGMVTLLVTDGVRGLQICKEKDKQPRIWEDVPHVDKAFIVNIGDMMERWTNCLFRSTLHRVTLTTEERYSVALFLDPNDDCMVECLKSCCSEKCPPSFPPILSGDYLRTRFNLTYASEV